MGLPRNAVALLAMTRECGFTVIASERSERGNPPLGFNVIASEFTSVAISYMEQVQYLFLSHG